jgi:hypothetical protein
MALSQTSRALSLKAALLVGFIIRVGNYPRRRVVVVIWLKDATYILDHGAQTIHKQLKNSHGQPSSICDLDDCSMGDRALSNPIIGHLISAAERGNVKLI